MQTIADFTAKLPNGEEISLADKLGKVLLVVNTASKCGFTPQYDGLEALWRKYRDRGFEVIAFPCNQFGHQEPGDAGQIEEFCKVNFGLSFPLMGKIEVNGDNAAPLYDWMKAEAPGLMGTKSVKWNFTKFLIGRDGKVVTAPQPHCPGTPSPLDTNGGWGNTEGDREGEGEGEGRAQPQPSPGFPYLPSASSADWSTAFTAAFSSSMLPASPSASIMKRLATTVPKLPRLSLVFHFSDCMCPSTVPVRS